jgi:hypothetical protein
VPQEELDCFAEGNLPKFSHRGHMLLNRHMQGVARASTAAASCVNPPRI